MSILVLVYRLLGPVISSNIVQYVLLSIVGSVLKLMAAFSLPIFFIITFLYTR